MPVGGTPRLPFCIIRFPPHKTERFRTHPHAREAVLHGRAIKGIEGLEALGQTTLLQIGRALGGARLGHVDALLRWGHDFLIDVPLGLFRARQALHGGVIGATGENYEGAQEHASPAPALSVIPHSILLLQDGPLTGEASL